MIRLWNKIINIGIDENIDPLRKKSIQLTNGICLITIFMGMNFYPNVTRFLPETLTLFIILTFALLFYIPTFIFSYYRFHLIAKIHLLIMASINITTPAILLGKGQNFHFYLLTVIGISYFIFEAKEKIYQYSIIIYVSILFVATDLWLMTHKAAMSFPTEFLYFAELNNDLGLLIFILGFNFYIYYNYTKAELALAEEKKKVEEEKAKSESLLRNILPDPIALRLKENNFPIADGFNSVTILFADIVGFTPLSEKVSPDDLVILLNTIFSEFDYLTKKYNIEKIKTIGDAYMVACGLPIPDTEHAVKIANFALEIRNLIQKLNQTHNRDLSIRIGIHSGPAVAGVIGITKFTYDVWGNTVNTASRMESHSLPNKIQVSEATYQLLKPHFEMHERGMIEIKGKDPMKTYLLEGRI